MWARVLLPLVLLLLVGGCSKAPPKAIVEQPAPAATDPDTKLYGALREGAFRLNAASSSLGQALKSSLGILKQQRSGTELFERLDEVVSLVDEAGEAVSEHSAAPPAVDAIKQKFSAYDDKRLAAITASNDALRRLDLAQKHLASTPSSKALAELGDVIELAQDEIEGAVIAFGGKVETPTD